MRTARACALSDRSLFFHFQNFVIYDFPSSQGYLVRWNPHGSTSRWNFVFDCVRSSQGFLRIMKSGPIVFNQQFFHFGSFFVERGFY